MPTIRGNHRGQLAIRPSFRILIAIAAVIGLSAAALSPLGDDGFVYPDEADLNGDTSMDTIVLLPQGDGEEGEGGVAGSCTIGEVRIVSGTTGQTITRFVASTCDDSFGSAVSIIRDVDVDGNDDLIIGAPLNGAGRAYVFRGPFGTGTGTQVIYANEADLEFFAPPGIERFGERVGIVSDLNGDGVPDLRIRGRATSGTGSLIRTFFVSGSDGFPLFVVRGSSPFNPWLRPQADVDDDGDVDAADLATVSANQGLSGSTVGIFQGDVNGNHVVNAADLTIVQNAQGINQFTPIDIGTDPDVGGDWGIWICPPTIAANFWCIPNCWDLDLYLPINVDPLCQILTCQAWCGFEIVDHGAALMPFETYAKPYVFEAVNGLELESLQWEFLEGGERVQMISDMVGRTLEVIPLRNGPIKVRATNEICTYICHVDAENYLQLVDSDGDGMPNAWETLWPGVLDPQNPLDAEEDPDLDGIKNLYEFAYGTDPTTFDAPEDTDGDGIPDSCEVSVGSDPNDPRDPANPQLDSDGDGLPDYYEQCVFWTDPENPDTDGDAIPDGWEIGQGLDPLFAPDALLDSDGDGLINLFEFFVDTDPNDPFDLPPIELDWDQDGYINWLETLFGSNPQDPMWIPEPGAISYVPGDMAWAVLNGGIVPLDGGVIEMCVGDCFKLHGSGWAFSWQVLQGGNLIEEEEPDTPFSCLSAKWCIVDGPGTIVLGGATMGAGGAFFGTLTIVVKPQGECEYCPVHVDPCGGGRDPEVVCVGEEICLTASGVEGPGQYLWTVLEFAQFVGPSTRPTVTVKITSPGEITVSASKNGCVGGVTFAAISVDLDIDSDNNNGVGLPNRSESEEQLETNPASASGKLTFTGLSDTDADGVPDWADGVEIAGLSAGTSGAAFVPLVLDVPDAALAALDDPSAYVALAYDMSDPTLIAPDDLSVRPGGAFRLWTKDGTSLRNPLPVTQGGDLVAPGVQLDRAKLNSMRSGGGTVTLYLEAVGPTATEAQRTVAAAVVFSATASTCSSPVTDVVKVAAVEIEALDARAWGPVWSPETGRSLANPDLDADMASSAHIGGAITDGASLCVFRLKPYFPEIGQVWPSIEIAMTKGGDPTVNEAKVVGTFHSVSGEAPALPPLPTPFDALQAGQAVTAPITSGKAFYVPPETYADPTETLSAQSLNVLEECLMRVELREGTTPVASRAFLLRRPPLVLVHGILSGPATWLPAEWNEAPGSPVPTRVYKADWSATSAQGYSENYGIFALTIEEALTDYRTANDNGHASVRSFNGIRYAATRADVVAHSQGGQLARFYIADGMPTSIDRVGWIAPLLNQRSEANTAGNWPYLRSGNYGAGSIRRLVTLGSPFRGSPLANSDNLILAPGGRGQPPATGWFALLAWYNSGQMPAGMGSLLFAGTPGQAVTYLEPTCAADLATGSDAQLALEAALYPSGHRQVRWYPIVGIATQSAGGAPVEATLWELLFSFLPGVPNDPTEISPLSPTNSDLIVPAASQRNFGSAGSPNELAGQGFQFTAHVAAPGLSGETSSVEIAVKVRSLLSGWPTIFNTSWKLGP